MKTKETGQGDSEISDWGNAIHNVLYNNISDVMSYTTLSCIFLYPLLAHSFTHLSTDYLTELTHQLINKIVGTKVIL